MKHEFQVATRDIYVLSPATNVWLAYGTNVLSPAVSVWLAYGTNVLSPAANVWFSRDNTLVSPDMKVLKPKRLGRISPFNNLKLIFVKKKKSCFI